MTKQALLAELLAATPVPPAQASAAELVRAANAMVAARAAILAAHPDVRGDADPAQLAELEARNAAWATAVAATRDEVGLTRTRAAKARAYAGAYRQSPRR
jgi:hypothetical protein